MKFPLFFVSRCKSHSPVMTDPLYLRVESYASTKLDKGKNAKDALNSLPRPHMGKSPVFKHHILQGKYLKHYYGQREVDLSNQHLSPSDVSSLKYIFHRGLKKINLSGCGLTQFPTGLDVCIRLEELNLSNNPLGDSNISSFLESILLRVCRLKKLNLSGCDLKQFHLDSCFWELEELDLSNNSLGHSNIFSFVESIHENTPELKKLNLSGCGLKEFHLHSHLHSHFWELEELNLSNNPLGDSNISSSLESFHENTPELKKLNLSGCGLKQFHLHSRFWELEELNLSNNPLDDSNISSSLESILLRVCRLRKLNLSGCGLKQSHLDSCFWNLEELDLSNNPLGDSNISSFFESIHENTPELKKLNLSCCGLKQFHLHSLLWKLEELNLSNNPLGDSNISSFLESIHENTLELKMLNLSGCGLKQFHWDSHFWELEELDLSNNPLGDSSMGTTLFRELFRPSEQKSILHLCSMIWLKKLNLSDCGLKTWPYVVHQPLNLEELNLSNNFINHQHTFENLASSLSWQKSDKPLELAPIGLGFFVAKRIIFEDAVYIQTNEGRSFG